MNAAAIGSLLIAYVIRECLKLCGLEYADHLDMRRIFPAAEEVHIVAVQNQDDPVEIAILSSFDLGSVLAEHLGDVGVIG